MQKLYDNQIIIAKEIQKTRHAFVKLVHEIRVKNDGLKINYITVIKEAKDLAYYESKLDNHEEHKNIKTQLRSLFSSGIGIRPSVRICLDALFAKESRHLFGLTGANNSIPLQNTKVLNLVVGKMLIKIIFN